MAIQGQDHLVQPHAQFPSGGVDDAEIGLVRYQPVELARIDAGSGQGLGHDLAQTGNRHLEHVIALHIHVGFELGARHAATGLRQLQQLAITAVGVQVG
ncbi:hypothetical protein D3C78_1133560 [compost metagenome]